MASFKAIRVAVHRNSGKIGLFSIDKEGLQVDTVKIQKKTLPNMSSQTRVKTMKMQRRVVGPIAERENTLLYLAVLSIISNFQTDVHFCPVAQYFNLAPIAKVGVNSPPKTTLRNWQLCIDALHP